MQSHFCSLLLLFALVASTAAADKRVSVTVQAGDFERQQTVVTFTLPEKARDFNQLRDPQGKSYPLQVDKEGRASFVVPQLNKGTKTIYELVPASAALPSAATAKREHTKVNIS